MAAAAVATRRRRGRGDDTKRYFPLKRAQCSTVHATREVSLTVLQAPHSARGCEVARVARRAPQRQMEQMELSEKHEPPCPSSQPSRSSLKSPHGSRVDLDNLSGDDNLSDMPLGEFPC